MILYEGFSYSTVSKKEKIAEGLDTRHSRVLIKNKETVP